MAEAPHAARNPVGDVDAFRETIHIQSVRRGLHFLDKPSSFLAARVLQLNGGGEGRRRYLGFSRKICEFSQRGLAPDPPAGPDTRRLCKPPLVVHLRLGNIKLGVNRVEIALPRQPAFHLPRAPKHRVLKNVGKNRIFDTRQGTLQREFSVARHQVVTQRAHKCVIRDRGVKRRNGKPIVHASYSAGQPVSLEAARRVVKIAVDNVEGEHEVLRFRIPTALHLPEPQRNRRVVFVARKELEVPRAGHRARAYDRLLGRTLERDLKFVGLLNGQLHGPILLELVPLQGVGQEFLHRNFRGMQTKIKLRILSVEKNRPVDRAAELIRDGLRRAHGQEMSVRSVGRKESQRPRRRVEEFRVVPEYDVLEGDLQRYQKGLTRSPIDPQGRPRRAGAHEVLRRWKHDIYIFRRDQVRLHVQIEIFQRGQMKFNGDMLFRLAGQMALEVRREVFRAREARHIEAKRLDPKLGIPDDAVDLKHAVLARNAEAFLFLDLKRSRLIDTGRLRRIPRRPFRAVDEDARAVQHDAIDNNVAVKQIVQTDVDQGRRCLQRKPGPVAGRDFDLEIVDTQAAHPVYGDFPHRHVRAETRFNPPLDFKAEGFELVLNKKDARGKSHREHHE